MNIYEGTSGYFYRDWFGIFYPKGLSGYKLIEYYSKFFSIVEINSSYYRLPSIKSTKNLKRYTPEDFRFFYKLPKEFTHKRKFDEKLIESFKEATYVLEEKLVGFLAQFPESFKYSSQNLEYIISIKELFKDKIFVVEFRHKSWLKENVFSSLREHKIVFSSVDEPQLENLLPPKLILTSNIAYIRFHSRDKEKWYKGGGLRYDYYYSKEELMEWIEQIKEKKHEIETLYIFFNNCHHGNAIKNAKEFVELINAFL